ncbi:MAG: DUF4134 domain-containing protein, partial [Prevotellaceae bacterium]|nr:DUF4134 domain-containing protein [Prevotellaceae bacterium]
MKVKKLPVLLLAAISLCAGIHTAKAQTFNDPLHMASNVLQFSFSLDAAIQSVEGVERIWDASVKTTEHLKEIKDQVEKARDVLQDMQDVRDAMRDLIEMADMVTALARQLEKASSVLSWEETTMALDLFTTALTRATNNVKTIKEIVGDKWIMPEVERIKAIREAKEKTTEEMMAMKETMLATKNNIAVRQLQKKIFADFENNLLHRAVLSSANAAVIATGYEEGERTSLEDMVVAASAVFGDWRKLEKETKSTAESKVSGMAGIFFGIYYGICGIMGLIGAYKVYRKVQLGEDFGRSAGVWLLSAL